MEEELIRDQLAEHATHPKIREKLIMSFCTGCGVVIFLDDINTCHPRRENVVADILSRSTPPPAVDPNPDPSDLDLIKLLHSPLAATVSLQELQQASEQDPVLSRLHTFIHSGANHPAFTILDWVRVRRSTRDHKLSSFWSAPLPVTEQLGPATFRLSDGTRWHARRLRKVAPPSAADPDPDFGGPVDPAARLVRARAKPGYLRDYFVDS
ncbi:unnamed protein product [Arctogadus glacialis]